MDLHHMMPCCGTASLAVDDFKDWHVFSIEQDRATQGRHTLGRLHAETAADLQT